MRKSRKSNPKDKLVPVTTDPQEPVADTNEDDIKAKLIPADPDLVNHDEQVPDIDAELKAKLEQES